MLSARRASFFYLWARRHDAAAARLYGNLEVFAEAMDFHTFYQQAVSITGRLWELFNRISGPYPVDVVFTSRAGAVPALILGLATDPTRPVPCVLMEPRVYAPGAISHQTVTELDAGARALGYAMAVCVYLSDWERDEAIRCVSMWLSAAAVKRAEDNAFVVPSVIDVPEIEPVTSGRKRILFTGRINANKRVADLLTSYALVAQARSDVEVWVHAGTGAFKKLDAKDNRWHRTSERFPLREQYHQLLAGTSVAAYASHEGVNATVLELLAAGVPMALPRRPWVMKLFAPIEYPFTYARFEELPSLLDWLLDNRDEAKRDLTPVRELIRDRHGRVAWAAGWDRVIGAVDDWNARNKLQPLDVFCRLTQALLKNGPVSFPTALKATGATKAPPYRRFVQSNYAAYLAVRQWDDYSSAQPRLVE